MSSTETRLPGVGVTLNASTLLVLLGAALFGGRSLDAQVDAIHRLGETLVELRADVQRVRDDLGALRRRVETIETVAPRVDRLERQLERVSADLEMVAACARDRRRCD